MGPPQAGAAPEKDRRPSWGVEAGFVAAAAGISGAIAAWVLRLRSDALTQPFAYSSDALFYQGRPPA